MRLTACLVLVSLAVAPLAAADNWKKPYFGATRLGSWAKYSDMSGEMGMTATYTLSTDDQGRRQVEVRTEVDKNQFPTVVNRYVLKPGFAIDRDLADFMADIVAGSVSMGETPMRAHDPKVLASMRSHALLYGPSVVFKGTETINGRRCDHYAYKMTGTGASPVQKTGDIWLSDAVPFGVVKETAETRTGSGPPTAFSRVLTASGGAPAKK